MPDLFTEFFKPDKAQARSMKPKLEKNQARPGLPDGFFSDQKSQSGYILEGLRMENIVTYSGR
jgi:hypothetical protein